MNRTPRCSRVVVALIMASSFSSATIAAGQDLLKKVDVAQDAVTGKWRRHGEKGKFILCKKAEMAKLRLPVPPKGDYNLRVVFTREKGDGPVGVVLVRDNVPFTFMIGGKKAENTEGFALSDGQSTGQNVRRAGKEPVKVKNSQTVKFVVAVRGDSVTVRVNSKAFAVHKADDADLTLAKEAMVIEDGRLGLVALNARTVFHEVKLGAIKKLAERTEVSRPEADARGPVAAGIHKGTIWRGTFRNSLNGQSRCRMRITSRHGTVFKAVVHFGRGGALRVKFKIGRKAIKILKVSDVSRTGTRRFIDARLDLSAEAAVLRLDFIYNSGRRKNLRISATLDMTAE